MRLAIYTDLLTLMPNENERSYTIKQILAKKLQVCLKAHRQISKKRFFEKYCSYDQACQFTALQGAP